MSGIAARNDLRNVAIIAHVDHGKTTLVDGLLRACGAFRENESVEERVMDSGDLEKERGITIQSKSTSVEYGGVRIQLVDTPGHADFGGEVERVLGMADACLLLCDAYEGVMPQTRFVLRKALAHGLRPILIVNKIDRPEERAEEVVTEVFDLLVELGADDTQLDFPVVYASAKNGIASTEYGGEMKDLIPILDAIVEHAPAPQVDEEGPLQFQAVTLGYDSFVGRLVIGRVVRGRMKRDSCARGGRARIVSRDEAIRHAGDRPRRYRRGACGRYRDRGRCRFDRRRRYGLRSRPSRTASAHRDRPADDPRPSLREQFALRGPRRKIRDESAGG
jgi:GTP-binding protein TypA/BipA